jgi:PEP-CTERM motif
VNNPAASAFLELNGDPTVRHGLLMIAAIGIALFSNTATRAQNPVFGGSLNATLVPSDSSVDGSNVNFTAAGSFSTDQQPFLLGKVDFLAGGAAKSFVFTAGLEVQSSNGTHYMAYFSTQVPVVDATQGTQSAQSLVFRGNPSDTVSVDGRTFQFDLAGVTSSNVYTNPDNQLVSTGGDRQESGYVWGAVAEQQTMTDTGHHHDHHHHCHQTPEPSTWLMASLAVIGTIGWQWRRRVAQA